MAKIQLRADTSAKWESANPILLTAEIGFETDTQRFKVGNGTDSWTATSYSFTITGATRIVSICIKSPT